MTDGCEKMVARQTLSRSGPRLPLVENDVYWVTDILSVADTLPTMFWLMALISSV